MASHRSVEYDHNNQVTVRGFAWRRVSDGVYEATGKCPICEGTMTRRWERGQYAYVSKGGRWWQRSSASDDPALGPLYTPCLCGRTHAGRPGDDPGGGCGAHLQIELPLEGLPE